LKVKKMSNAYELIKLPSNALRQKSKPVKVIDNSVREIAEHMGSQLEPLEAVGFAAPQFGQPIRVIVVRRDAMTTLAIVNPEVVKERGACIVLEGCRSVPGKWYWVRRPKIVKVRGLGLNGNPISVRGSGLLAQALKPEIDHLDGILVDTIGKEAK